MKRTIFGGLLAILCQTAAAEPPAGVVVYYPTGGEIYLLLAEHAGNDRGWAGFGGGGREGETMEETAAHKGAEESRGYFQRADLLLRIKGQTPVMDGPFAAYFAEVPFVPAPRVMNHTPPEANDTYLERGAFAWIPYSTIEGYLKADIDRTRKYPVDPAFLPAGAKTPWFWPVWLGNMRAAYTSNRLPWKQN
jgi:ADP-ribose pyrophosphatase YjhB (NUDIX family)